MNRYRLPALLAALLISLTASAQAKVDSTLLGVDILSLIGQKAAGTATVNQSYEIRNALSRHIVTNASTKLQGYRVRIFFDSDRTARSRSEAIAAGFSERYPSIPVYRSHVSPYFKVTVGDFRTRDDAQRFASKLTNSGLYRYVFVVKEQINYPGF
jgi:Sporulation related domain.